MSLPVPEQWELFVTVYLPNGTLFASQGRVKVFDVYNGTTTQLNVNAIGANGVAELSWNRTNFQQGDLNRESPNLMFMVTDWNDRTLFQSSVLMYPKVNQTAKVTLTDTAGSGGTGTWTPGQSDLVPDTAPAIFGYLRNKPGLPIVGRTVYAKHIYIDKGQVNYVVLGSSVTNKRGYYSIPISVSSLHNSVSSGNSVFVSVLEPESSPTIEIVSDTVTMKSTRIQVDCVADFTSEAEDSQWSELSEAIYEAFGKYEVSADLVEQKTFRKLVADKVGWPVEDVLAYAQAWNIHRDIVYRVGLYNGFNPNNAVSLSTTDGMALLTADLMYSFTSTGIATTFDNAISIPISEVHKRWVDSIAKKVVPYSLGAKLTIQLEKWREISIALLSEERLSHDPIAKAIRHIFVDETTREKQTIILGWWLDADGNLDELEAAVQADSDILAEQDKKKLQLLFDSYRFTDGFADMAYAMVSNGKKESSPIESYADFFGWSLNKWIEIIDYAAANRIQSWSTDKSKHNPNLPDDFPGKDLYEQKLVYANKLMDKVKVMARPVRLKQELVDAMANNPELQAKAKELVGFLALYPSTNLDEQTIEDLSPKIVEYVESAYAELTPEEKAQKVVETRTQVCTAQRVYRLTDRGTGVAYLISCGLDSAYAIARIEENTFVAAHYKGLGGFDKARQIHRTASHHAGELLFKIAMNQQTVALQGSSLSALPRSTTGELPIKSPTDYSLVQRSGYVSAEYKAQWKTLFGNMIQCACGECQSVFGAAAYFVDLIQFLPEKMLSQLQARRPDLLNVELTCKNTNTPMPYIDLVNEVLEGIVQTQVFRITESSLVNEWIAVINDPSVYSSLSVAALNGFTNAGLRLTEEAEFIKGVSVNELIILDGSWRYAVKKIVISSVPQILVTPCAQTYWSAERLGTFPEHLNAKAYDALTQKAYPLNLPFNLWSDESRIYRKVLGTPKNELLRVFGNESNLAQRICDYFSISEEQAALIDNRFPVVNRITDGALWGLESNGTLSVVHPTQPDKQVRGTWIDVLECFAVFQKRSQLSTSKVFELLNSKWIAKGTGDGSIYVLPTSEEGYQTCETDLLSIDGWSAARLNRAARLIRALKWTSLSIAQIDAWLMATQADSDFIDLAELYSDCILVDKYSSTLPTILALRPNVGIEGAFDAAKNTTLFTYLFQNERLGEAYLSGFRNVLAVALELSAEKLPKYDKNYRQIIETKLGITSEDWVYLFSATVPETIEIRLVRTNEQPSDIPTLNELFRIVMYCKFLQVKLPDYVRFFKEWKDDVALSWTPRTLEELEAIKAELLLLSENSMGVDDLAWLSRDVNKEDYLLEKTVVEEFFAGLEEEATRLRETVEKREQSQLDVLRDNVRAAVLNGLSSVLAIDVKRLGWLSTSKLHSVQDAGKMAIDVWVDFFVKYDDEWLLAVDRENAKLALWSELRFLEKIAFTVVKADISLELAVFLSTLDWNKGAFEAWKWTQWKELLSRNSLTHQKMIPGATMLSIWAAIQGGSASEAEVLGLLVPKTALTVDELLWLFHKKGIEIGLYNDADLIHCWSDFFEAIRLYKKIDLDVIQIDDQLLSKETETSTLALRDSMQRLLGESVWYDKAAPMRNQLRELQRNALVDYILTSSDTDAFSSAEDLYAYYLIDVEMNSDMQASRINRAIGSVQQLIQRTLIGLESACSIDEERLDLWTWMKNYRVWEANRKVFLYPENWLEPDLRDDKTPFFKELEAELEETDITQESAEAALVNYLAKVSEVANLLIMGAYRQSGGPDGVKSVLHVVGRTHSIPYKYYIREYHEKDALNGIWTPWEEVSVEISSPTLFPAVFNNRLYLLWPTYNLSNLTDTDSFGSSEKGKDSSHDGWLACDSQNLLEIKLNWTERAIGGKWSKPKSSSSSLVQANDVYVNVDPRNEALGTFYQFRARPCTSDYMAIDVMNTTDVFTGEGENKRSVQTLNYLGSFSIWKDGSTKTVASTNKKSSNVLSHLPSRSRLDGNIVEESTLALLEDSNPDNFIYPSHNELLGNTPDDFRVISANMDFLTTTDSPFFYADDGKTYLVEKVETSGKVGFKPGEQKAFRFTIVSHPMVATFQERMARGGLTSLMKRETQALPVAENYYYSYNYYNYYFNIYMGYYIAGDWRAWDTAQNQFEYRYLPTDAVAAPYPIDVVDFSYGSSMGIYNWELFFHVPVFIALQFQRNQKYELAYDWFHHVFDPHAKLNGYEKGQRWVLDLPAGARFWNFLPFFANPDADKSVAESLGQINSSNPQAKPGELDTLVDEWKNNPFNPHLIARHRVVAYQKMVVMKYLDNLIAWGDMLFRQDTAESINEAIQIYTLANEILGERPEEVPSLTDRVALTTNDLRKLELDSFGNVLLEAENAFLRPSAQLRDAMQRSLTAKAKDALNIGIRMLYFGTPRNEFILKYWDIVADRLYKIRNSMNIDGVKRTLALFAPPIDPGMLVRAAAAGLDLGSVLADMNAPLPNYRYRRIWSKAVELCNEVKSLSSQVLSALEKKDAEALSILRSRHEQELLSLSKAVRTLQIEEADDNIAALEKTREVTKARFDYYSGKTRTIALEDSQLDYMGKAYITSQAASSMRLIGAGLAMVPDFMYGAQIGWAAAATTDVKVSGGQMLSRELEFVAKASDMLAASFSHSASVAGIKAGQEQRWQDWQFQIRTAEKELVQMDQQIEAAKIRKAIAEAEFSNLEAQIENGDEVLAFYEDKYTNKELYNWMIGEVGKLNSRMFQLAYDMAKKAERVYQFELRLQANSTSFIQSGHWENIRKGLLASERLSYDLQRMDVAYLNKHSREQEVVKNVSVAQLNPLALLDLQQNGTCSFAVPEWLYDLDFPGQVERRIKAVRVTIPCVAGPHTNVSARLRLKDNRVRTMQNATSYTYLDTDYSIGIAGTPSVSISHAQNDAGMFELNFNDERYLPFEGAGAISSWNLELGGANGGIPTFDYGTITDVILSISYTAQESSSNDRAKSKLAGLKGTFLDIIKPEGEGGGIPFGKWISLKRDFPELFQELLVNNKGDFSLTPRHFPYMFSVLANDALIYGKTCTIEVVQKDKMSALINKLQLQGATGDYDTATNSVSFDMDLAENKTLLGTRLITLSAEEGEKVVSAAIDDIVVSFTYKVKD